MHTDPSQLSAFDDDGWWDPEGFLYGLQALIGPLRDPYVLDTLRGSGASGGSRVLDIGSGGGLLTATLSDAGYTVIGTDPAMSAVRDAANHVSAPFALATGESLPFVDGSFDSVVCSEVLEHARRLYPDPRRSRRSSGDGGTAQKPDQLCRSRVESMATPRQVTCGRLRRLRVENIEWTR